MEDEKTIKAGVEMTVSLHTQVKIEAARRRMKMRDAVREAFTAWLNSEAAPPTANPLSKDSIADERELIHTDKAIKTLASEISERAAAILHIAEKVKAPEVGPDTTVPPVTEDDLYARITKIAADNDVLLDDIEEIKEQFGGAGRRGKKPNRKTSNG